MKLKIKEVAVELGKSAKEIYEEINKLEKSEIKVDKYIKKSHYFQYPLTGGMVLILLYFLYRNRRG